MTDEQFEKLVKNAIESIPKEFQQYLQNIAIVIQDEPDINQRKTVHLNSNMSLFGLYQGVPLTKRSGALLTFPDKITIFKKPILNAFQTEDEIVSQIRSTVLHEIGHYLGLSEKDLRRLRY